MDRGPANHLIDTEEAKIYRRGLITTTIPDLSKKSGDRSRRIRHAYIQYEANWERAGIRLPPGLRYGPNSPPMLALTGGANLGKTTLTRRCAQMVRDLNARQKKSLLGFDDVTILRFHTDRPPYRSGEEEEPEHIHISSKEMDELWPDNKPMQRDPDDRTVVAIQLPTGYRYVLRLKEHRDACVRGYPILMPCGSPEVAWAVKSGYPCHIRHLRSEWDLRLRGDDFNHTLRVEEEKRGSYQVVCNSWVTNAATKTDFLRWAADSIKIYPRPSCEEEVDQAIQEEAETIIELLRTMTTNTATIHVPVRWMGKMGDFRENKQALLEVLLESEGEIQQYAASNQDVRPRFNPVHLFWQEWVGASWRFEPYDYRSPLSWRGPR